MTEPRPRDELASLLPLKLLVFQVLLALSD